MDKAVIRRNIKKRAKESLKGSRFAAWGVLIIPVILTLAFAMIDLMITFGLGYPLDTPSEILAQDSTYVILTLITGVISFLLVTPVLYGIREWFLELGDGRKQPVTFAFGWYSSLAFYGKSIGQSLLVGILSTLWSLLFIVPLVFAIPPLAVLATVIARNIVIFGVELAFIIVYMAIILPIMLVSIFLTRYAAAPYIIILHPERTVVQTIGDSTRLMKGHKWEYFVFVLSFFLNFLLIPLTIGIAAFWVVPYFNQASALFFKYIEDFDTMRNHSFDDIPQGGSYSGSHSGHVNLTPEEVLDLQGAPIEKSTPTIEFDSSRYRDYLKSGDDMGDTTEIYDGTNQEPPQ